MQIGDTYYNWKVIDKGTKNGYVLCECQCENHAKQELRISRIVSAEAAKKCAICRAKDRSLVGKTFGKLKVMQKDEQKSTKKHTYYLCKCICGNPNLISVRSDHLTSDGHVQSCGCLAKGDNWWAVETDSNIPAFSTFTKDLTGERIGDWKVIRQVPRPDFETRSGAWWELVCLKCGETKVLKGIHISPERVGRCSLEQGSKGEQKIRDILNKNGINFQEQYTFLDLRPNNIPLRFDFALFKNDCLISIIEYQGEQHYHAISYFGGTEHFLKQQKNDELKRQYCLEHNIPLIEISYTHYNNLSLKDLLIETSPFLTRGEQNDL